jgi:hypothetical protein
MAAEASKSMLVGGAPLVSPGSDRREALSKAGDRVAVLAQGMGGVKGPDTDLTGALTAGNAGDCIEELAKFSRPRRGLRGPGSRLRMDESEDSVRQIGEEVLPVLTSMNQPPSRLGGEDSRREGGVPGNSTSR